MHPEVALVEIWVGHGSDSNLWVSTMPVGEPVTGYWMNPGALFIVKDPVSGMEWARAQMQGASCG